MSRHGYLERDKRLSGRAGYWRLRFRNQGRGRTVYVGSDTERVDRVRRELALLQAAHRHGRQLARAVQQGKKVLRESKARLAPVLLELGFHHHGDTIRKLRVSTKLTDEPNMEGRKDHGRINPS